MHIGSPIIACKLFSLFAFGPQLTNGFGHILVTHVGNIRHSINGAVVPSNQRQHHRYHRAKADGYDDKGYLSMDDLDARLKKCTTGTEARKLLTETLGAQSRTLYNSLTIPVGASAKGISDGDLAIQTRLANKKYKIMDLVELNGDRDADRASLSVLIVFVSSTLAAVVANQNLPVQYVPEIVRFIIVWLFCFAPLALVGYGIRDAEALQGTLVSVQRQVFPAYRQRMIQHEAGHFLMGHLLGWPIQAYVTNAVRDSVSFYPLADPDVGPSRANQLGFDRPKTNRPLTRDDYTELVVETAPYYSKEGRGRRDMETKSVVRNTKNVTASKMLQISQRDDPTSTWPYRGFPDSTMDQLTVISVAGVCAEIIAFGNAQGGRADFGQLRQIFGAASNELSEKDMENRIRFALGFTMTVLRRNLGVLDALAAVMERGGSVADCIGAIETCDNVSGRDELLPSGDFELRRREAFRSQGLGPLERLLLGGDRTIDTLEDRLLEGKGGGSRKNVVRLTGDDPFYLAIAVALFFLLWASSGGLSLH